MNLAERSCVIIPGEGGGGGGGEGKGEQVEEQEVDASLFVPNLFLRFMVNFLIWSRDRHVCLCLCALHTVQDRKTDRQMVMVELKCKKIVIVS